MGAIWNDIYFLHMAEFLGIPVIAWNAELEIGNNVTSVMEFSARIYRGIPYLLKPSQNKKDRKFF